MRLGHQLFPCQPGEHGNQFDTTLAVAQACEDAGMDAVFMPDHFMFHPEDPAEQEPPVMEAFTVLGAIAARTSRIRIGQLVTGVPYRNPALLAKILATLDVISHGRCFVGLGAAWHEPEFSAYGWPFPPVAERMARLEEAVQIVDRMLSQQPASFSGQYYTIKEAYNEPMPVQKPRPPIMIGGGGERVTLRLVAQYADYCNVFGDPETVAHKYDVLRQHCQEVGRPYEQITRSNHVGILVAPNEKELAAQKEAHPDFGGVAGTPEQVVDQLKAYAAVGSQYITFNLAAKPDDLPAIRLLGETVIPHLADR